MQIVFLACNTTQLKYHLQIFTRHSFAIWVSNKYVFLKDLSPIEYNFFSFDFAKKIATFFCKRNGRLFWQKRTKYNAGYGGRQDKKKEILLVFVDFLLLTVTDLIEVLSKSNYSNTQTIFMHLLRVHKRKYRSSN